MIPIDLIKTILVAEYFIKYIFKLYGFPNLIISNYKSQFILDFWQALYKQLNIQIQLLIIFYSETDR